MENTFKIPTDIREHEDEFIQIIAGRTAIEEFLNRMFDNPDVFPERILHELMIRMDLEASKQTEDAFRFYTGFEALNEIDAVFFGGGTE